MLFNKEQIGHVESVIRCEEEVGVGIRYVLTDMYFVFISGKLGITFSGIRFELA